MKKMIVMAALLLCGAASLNLWAQDLPRLAVVEFSVNDSAAQVKKDATTVRNLAESQMVASGKYQIIARDDIDKILADQKIAVSAISSAENVKRLQLMNISYIVTGSVDSMGADYAITVRVLDVASGKFSHSDNELMGGGSREMYTGVNTLMARFNAGMSTGEGGAIVQGTAKQTRPSNTGIAIEVSTKTGGILYFQNEEIATLWDNDTHTIPIEKPGTYTVKLVLSDGQEKTTSVSIASRGITKVDFSTIYVIGETGPAGGIVFYNKGSVSSGWRYLEAAPASAEFQATWNDALNRCNSLSVGGHTGWRLPDRGELDLMYKNLKQKGLGGFSNNWYWSSSQYNYSDAWAQNFGDGRQDDDTKYYPYSVRAVRAF